ncbi:transcriptional regulator [Gorillibacterium sp. sgz5001074]|uniref:transcriptional regulator n=1 Tax=Gorillibacterium sp. sgz5001074 TaxID=3446695 RepID=UPI003F664C20
MTRDQMLIVFMLIPVLLAQSTYLFIDARKRDRYPWFWGLWGLIQAPMPILLYLLLVRKIYRWRRK